MRSTKGEAAEWHVFLVHLESHCNVSVHLQQGMRSPCVGSCSVETGHELSVDGVRAAEHE
eukprot:3528650-Rhodomonas_salina.3